MNLHRDAERRSSAHGRRCPRRGQRPGTRPRRGDIRRNHRRHTLILVDIQAVEPVTVLSWVVEARPLARLRGPARAGRTKRTPRTTRYANRATREREGQMTSWIQPITPRPIDHRRGQSFVDLVGAFHDRQHRQALEQLRRARRLLELGFGGAQERRRAEDRIRLERHDSCAVTIKAGKRV
jgi:hypothetical protein